MREAWEALERPGFDIPTVLVGGTNGKGSTVEFLASLIRSDGSYRAGIFTSPHVTHFRERIRTTHLKIDDIRLSEVWKDIHSALGEKLYNELSFFEVTTLMGLVLFRHAETDFNILEVGLGGRWDATNVVDPCISVITSIGYDHQGFLGDTLLEIGREKLGIAREGRPLFVGHSSDFEHDPCWDQFVEEIRATRAQAFFYDYDFDCDNERIVLPTETTVQIPAFVRRQPSFLQHNFALACAVYDDLQRTRLPLLKSLDDVLHDTKALQKPPGRYEKLEVENRKVILDVCHNTSGARALVQALKDEGVAGRIPAFVCILKDKDWQEMLTIFKGFFDPLVLFRVKSERSWTAQDMPRIEECMDFYDSFEEAWNGLHKGDAERREPYVVCGSIAAMGEVFEFLESKSCREGWSSATLDSHRPKGIQPGPL